METQIPCPGCATPVHRRATECPHCGYRAEVTNYQELLGSLSTVSSILIGFGLAGLISLATGEITAVEAIIVQVAAGAWILSSIFLLMVLIVAEVVRRREPGDSVIVMKAEEHNRLVAQCEILLRTFLLSLILLAAGVVILSFHFSLWHGLISVAVVVIAVFVGIYCLTRP